MQLTICFTKAIFRLIIFLPQHEILLLLQTWNIEWKIILTCHKMYGTTLLCLHVHWSYLYVHTCVYLYEHIHKQQDSMWSQVCNIQETRSGVLKTQKTQKWDDMSEIIICVLYDHKLFLHTLIYIALLLTALHTVIMQFCVSGIIASEMLYMAELVLIYLSLFLFHVRRFRRRLPVLCHTCIFHCSYRSFAPPKNS